MASTGTSTLDVASILLAYSMTLLSKGSHKVPCLLAYMYDGL